MDVLLGCLASLHEHGEEESSRNVKSRVSPRLKHFQTASASFATADTTITLAGGASLVQGLFIEADLTFKIVFTIFLLAEEKHKVTFVAPVGIGMSVFTAELVGVFYTGGSLNPARVE